MNIAKAIVPVAGLGTRLLPTTKSLSKEMLPVGRLPVVHHVVEELAATLASAKSSSSPDATKAR